MNKLIGTAAPLSAIWNEMKMRGNLDVAEQFLDWLKTTNQNAWQMLPLHETQLVPGSFSEHVPSPYKGYGVGLNPDYLSQSLKEKLPTPKSLEDFNKKHKNWLPNYALFCALRDEFGTDDWTNWDPQIRDRNPITLQEWQETLNESIKFHKIEQWQLHKGFEKLREKAYKYGIKLVGDLSFYLPLQSPLVWEFQHCFKLDKNRRPQKVSGLPDGPKAHFGRQIWGHPLYNWEQKEVYNDLLNLWKDRLNYTTELFDVVRFDHAKGLFHYGSMDINDPKKDTIEKGPGAPMLKKIIQYAKTIKLDIFAEDSGDRLTDLRTTLKELKVPGIRIFRFAYNEKRKKLSERYANIQNYPKNTFTQSTTHDTETLLGYLKLISNEEKKLLCTHARVDFNPDDQILATRIRNAIINSPAKVVIIPIQDWLLETNRINIPGTEKEVGDTNWQYKVSLPIEKLPTKLSSS